MPEIRLLNILNILRMYDIKEIGKEITRIFGKIETTCFCCIPSDYDLNMRLCFLTSFILRSRKPQILPKNNKCGEFEDTE